MELFGHPSVAVAGPVKTNLLDLIPQVCLDFKLPERLVFIFIIEGAARDLHELTPPLDTGDEALVKINELSFSLCSLRVFSKAFFKNAFSKVTLPSICSSWLMRSRRAASSTGSLLSLPRAYWFFQ